MEPFSRKHQIIYLGGGGGVGWVGSAPSGMEGWPEPGPKPLAAQQVPGSPAGRWDPALPTLWSWNAGTEAAGQSLGPLEAKKVQHEERWSVPTKNGRYIAKSLILFLKKKNTYHQGYTQTVGRPGLAILQSSTKY